MHSTTVKSIQMLIIGALMINYALASNQCTANCQADYTGCSNSGKVDLQVCLDWRNDCMGKCPTRKRNFLFNEINPRFRNFRNWDETAN